MMCAQYESNRVEELLLCIPCGRIDVADFRRADFSHLLHVCLLHMIQLMNRELKALLILDSSSGHMV